MNKKNIIFWLACVFNFSTATLYAADYYVKTDGTGNGSSWENAMSGEDFALILPSVPNDVTFHIAEGTYVPTQILSNYSDTNPQLLYLHSCYGTNKVYEIKSNITLKGGYPPDARMDDVANPSIYKTVLTSPTGGDTSKHPSGLIAAGVNVNLEGLTFSKIYNRIYNVNLTIKDCTFENNITTTSGFSSCWYIEISNTNIDITNSVFQNNKNAYGCFYISCVADNNTPGKININIENSTFKDNNNSYEFYSCSSNLDVHDITIKDCLFSGNAHEDYRHLFGLSGINVSLINNMFFENKGDLYFTGDESNILLTGNTFINNSGELYIDCNASLVNNTFANHSQVAVNFKKASLIHNSFINSNIRVNSTPEVEFIGNIFALNNQTNTFNINTNGAIKSDYNVFTTLPTNGGTTLWQQGSSDIVTTLQDLSTILDGTMQGGVFTPNVKDNGGFTPTVALTYTRLPNGTEINHVPISETNVTVDQRGIERNNLSCVGAFENPVLLLEGYYVKVNGAGRKDGSSWENAMDATQFAQVLPRVPDNTTFYIAAGEYRPEVGIADMSVYNSITHNWYRLYRLQYWENENEKVYEIKSNVSLIGGYPASAQTGDIANSSLYKTIFKSALKGSEDRQTSILVSYFTTDVKLKGITFKEAGYGGAISLYDMNITIDSCLFEDNWSRLGYTGACIDAAGTCSIKVSNSTFNQNPNPWSSLNPSQSSNAIVCGDWEGKTTGTIKLDIQNSIFNNGNGSVIQIDNSNSNINIEKNTFSNNHRVINGYAKSISLSYNKFENNEDASLFVNADYSYLIGNTFVNNKRGIELSNGVSGEDGEAVLINNTFVNQVGSYFYVDTISLINNTIIADVNSPSNIMFYGGKVVLINNTIIGNLPNFLNFNTSNPIALIGNIFALGNQTNTFNINASGAITSNYNVFTTLPTSSGTTLWQQGSHDIITIVQDLSTILDGTFQDDIFTPNLKNNGGSTPTVALTSTKLPDDTPVNIVPQSVSNVSEDQRGVSRKESACVGAYEIDCGFNDMEISITSDKAILCKGENAVVRVEGIDSLIERNVSYEWSTTESGVEITDAGKNPALVNVTSNQSQISLTVKITDACGTVIVRNTTLDVSGVGDVSFSGLNNRICSEAEIVTLTPNPSGGIFTGLGITDGNKYNPALVTGGKDTVVYKIKIPATDACYSFSKQAVEIVEPSVVLQLGGYAKNAVCNSGNGLIKFNISGGDGYYTYTINNGAEILATADSVSLTPVANTYTIRAWQTSDVCASTSLVTQAFTITEPQSFSIAASLSGKLCQNASINTTIAGGTKPYSYTWTTPTDGITSGETSNNTISLNVDELGEYKIQVTDYHNCSIEKSQVTVSRNANLPELVFGNIQTEDESCFGANNGTASIAFSNNTGGEAVFIEVKNSLHVLVKSQLFTSATGTISLTGLAPGKYDVYLRYGAENCTLLSDKVWQNEFTIQKMEKSISFDSPTVNSLTCLNQPNGSFSVQVNGWANSHTALLGNTQVQPKSVNGQTAIFEIKNLAKGNYLLKITDKCSNANQTNISITGIEPYQLEIIETHDMLDCDYSEDGSIKVRAVGGYPSQGIIYMVGKEEDKYAASLPSVLFNLLPKGNYNMVYKTTQEGCTDNIVLPKTINAPERVYFDTDFMHISCYGKADGEISLQAYQGSNAKPSGNLPVTDEKAMKGLDGFTYEWIKSDDAGFNFTTQTIPLEHFWYSRYGDTIYNGVVGVDSLPIGKYICEVTINEGKCFYDSDSIEIKRPTYDSLKITNIEIGANANCIIQDRRVTIEATGGWNGYIFSLLTEDELAKAQSGNDSVARSQMDYYDGEEEEIIHHDDNSVTYLSGILMPGTYHVFVTDSLGCRAAETDTFTIDPVVKLDNTVVDSVRCPRESSGRVELIVTGSSSGPYIYEMYFNKDSIVPLDSHICENLPKGIYSFKVTESDNNCEGFITVEIKDNKLPYTLIEQSVENIKCNGKNDGEIKFFLSGASEPYTFKIGNDTVSASPDGIYQSVSSIGRGDHTLYVYDQNECLKTLNFTIEEPDLLQIDYIKESEICPGSDKGRLVVQDVSGGTKPYSYSLLGMQEFQTNPSLKADARTHTVLVKDANNCEASGSGTVRSKSGDDDPPKIDFLVSTWGYDSDVWVIIDISPEEPGQTRDSVSFSFSNDLIYKEDAAFYGAGISPEALSRMIFVGVKKDTADNFIGESDTLKLSCTVTMTVYYQDGCDYDKEHVIYVANDSIEIYPNGKLTQKQPDIISFIVSPNPVDRNGDYELEIEFANEVDFKIQAYSITGNELGNKDFPASKIIEGKATVSKQDLNINVRMPSIFRVSTLTDAASVIVLVVR